MLKELALIGFANAGDYFDWAPDGVSLLDKGDLTGGAAAGGGE